MLGVQNSSSDVKFDNEINGTSEQESYSQSMSSIDFSTAFSTSDVGLQAYVSKDSYSGKFREGLTKKHPRCMIF